MGAWTTYGLGSESENLPGFVVLNGGLIPPGAWIVLEWFLPATYQGSVFRPTGHAIANVTPIETTMESQRKKLDLLRSFDSEL